MDQVKVGGTTNGRDRQQTAREIVEGENKGSGRKIEGTMFRVDLASTAVQFGNAVGGAHFGRAGQWSEMDPQEHELIGQEDGVW
jgi:hypothetical protein